MQLDPVKGHTMNVHRVRNTTGKGGMRFIQIDDENWVANRDAPRTHESAHELAEFVALRLSQGWDMRKPNRYFGTVIQPYTEGKDITR